MIFVVGSGGLSLNNAVLHINAPVGSTIELSKGGVTVVTLNASKGHVNSDGVTADWYYSVSPSNYGEWTVSAAKDGETAAETVTVNSARQYDVPLSYNLYIVKNGEAQTGFEISYNGMTTHTLADGMLYMADADGARFAVGPLPSANNRTKAVFEFEKIETIGTASKAGIGNTPASSASLSVNTVLQNSAVPVTATVDISEMTVYDLYAKLILEAGNQYNIRKVWLKNIYLAR